MRLRQVAPLMVMATGGRASGPSVAITSAGTSTAVALPEGMTVAPEFHGGEAG